MVAYCLHFIVERRSQQTDQPNHVALPHHRKVGRRRDEIIFDFTWSHGGKQLILSRGSQNSDVVLISNAN
jgi:hypothetical protein